MNAPGLARVFAPATHGIVEMPLSTYSRLVEDIGVPLADDAERLVAPARENVIGHTTVLDSIEAALRAQPEHGGTGPRAIVLLAGEGNGNGKSTIARNIGAERGTTEILAPLVRQPHELASIVGVPREYVGHSPSPLHAATLQQGNLIIDEIEKAHPLTVRAMAGVVKNGGDHAGYPVDLRNNLMFVTTRGELAEETALHLAQEFEQPVTVINVPELTDEQGMAILDRDVANLVARAHEKAGIRVSFTDDAKVALQELYRGAPIRDAGGRASQIPVKAATAVVSDGIIAGDKTVTITRREIEQATSRMRQP